LSAKALRWEKGQIGRVGGRCREGVGMGRSEKERQHAAKKRSGRRGKRFT